MFTPKKVILMIALMSVGLSASAITTMRTTTLKNMTVKMSCLDKEQAHALQSLLIDLQKKSGKEGLSIQRDESGVTFTSKDQDMLMIPHYSGCVILVISE